MTKQVLMVGLGEILWDLLPSGKVLGGAPTNFAYLASVLGDKGIVASRIGNDDLGEQAQKQLQLLGLGKEYLQKDSQFGTGMAEVLIDSGGQPSFTIGESVAWDRLEWTPEWRMLANRADVICFGSLAQRAPTSAATIEHFLEASQPDSLRIFDVNLRQSYYSADVLNRSLRHANIVKLTDRELDSVAACLRFDGHDEEDLARRLLRKWQLKIVCVTRGARGSLLVSEQDFVSHPGFAVEVADSVGAGDAFTACLAHHFVRGRSLVEIGEHANRFASWVATQVGATPSINRVQVDEMFAGLNGIKPDSIPPGS